MKPNGSSTSPRPKRRVVMGAGQKPFRECLELLRAAGMKTHLIGGAGEFNAKQANDQETRLAAGLEQSERPAGVLPANGSGGHHTLIHFTA
ncbi:MULTISPECIES: hypothetical protein [unclassified Polaromonas]|nr:MULTISPECIES: hypothetical protein [unclassified Polaromonas]MBG6071660.1 hypothetical protein [Polaromonas sp. CG_9.7]MBG6113661.1 hypothetical protein [Polaromonas sp. CG_9.2]MDH6184441.1 hypothetical protein [Polaromonas sp. CG_23.6]